MSEGEKEQLWLPDKEFENNCELEVHRNLMNINSLPCQFADLYLHFPEDFNLDIRTNGSITGLNQGDTKLVAFFVNLEATDFIHAKRVKADSVKMMGKSITLSSVEFGRAKLVSKEGTV